MLTSLFLQSCGSNLTLGGKYNSQMTIEAEAAYQPLKAEQQCTTAPVADHEAVPEASITAEIAHTSAYAADISSGQALHPTPQKVRQYRQLSHLVSVRQPRRMVSSARAHANALRRSEHTQPPTLPRPSEHVHPARTKNTAPEKSQAPVPTPPSSCLIGENQRDVAQTIETIAKTTFFMANGHTAQFRLVEGIKENVWQVHVTDRRFQRCSSTITYPVVHECGQDLAALLAYLAKQRPEEQRRQLNVISCKPPFVSKVLYVGKVVGLRGGMMVPSKTDRRERNQGSAQDAFMAVARNYVVQQEIRYHETRLERLREELRTDERDRREANDEFMRAKEEKELAESGVKVLEEQLAELEEQIKQVSEQQRADRLRAQEGTGQNSEGTPEHSDEGLLEAMQKGIKEGAASGMMVGVAGVAVGTGLGIGIASAFIGAAIGSMRGVVTGALTADNRRMERDIEEQKRQQAKERSQRRAELESDLTLQRLRKEHAEEELQRREESLSMAADTCRETQERLEKAEQEFDEVKQKLGLVPAPAITSGDVPSSIEELEDDGSCSS